MMVCPNCGVDLKRFEPVEQGDLRLLAGIIWWLGKEIDLRPSGRLLVGALVRAGGRPLGPEALSNVMGVDEDADDPKGLVRTQICLARAAFRNIDPSFDKIESVWGLGYRWAS